MYVHAGDWPTPLPSMDSAGEGATVTCNEWAGMLVEVGIQEVEHAACFTFCTTERSNPILAT